MIILSNIYYCGTCSQRTNTWVRMEYVKWVKPWAQNDESAAGDLYRCPICGQSMVEYGRLLPSPNQAPQRVLEEGYQFALLQELINR
ncbi:MAG: hypothetical protein ACOYD6_09540 [Limnochordia bacterium]